MEERNTEENVIDWLYVSGNLHDAQLARRSFDGIALFRVKEKEKTEKKGKIRKKEEKERKKKEHRIVPSTRIVCNFRNCTIFIFVRIYTVYFRNQVTNFESVRRHLWIRCVHSVFAITRNGFFSFFLMCDDVPWRC